MKYKFVATVYRRPERAFEAVGGGRQYKSGAQSEQVLNMLQMSPLSILEIVHALKLKSKTGSLKRTVNDLLSKNCIEYTIPDKPNSRLQKYRLIKKGVEYLKKRNKK